MSTNLRIEWSIYQCPETLTKLTKLIALNPVSWAAIILLHEEIMPVLKPFMLRVSAILHGELHNGLIACVMRPAWIFCLPSKKHVAYGLHQYI